MTAGRGIPLWVKLVYSCWLAVWIPVYWIFNGPQNFLWLCDIANLVVGVAIWVESPLLFSSQAVSVLVIQLSWTIDVATRIVLGFHPIGGTEYMFDQTIALPVRLLSLFHIFVPLLLLWAVWRLGYDRRGWLVQTAIAWLVLPLTFLVTDPVAEINWVWGPFGAQQSLLPAPVYLLVTMALYPLVLYLPTHRALLFWTSRTGRALEPASPARMGSSS